MGSFENIMKNLKDFMKSLALFNLYLWYNVGYLSKI